MTISMRKGVDSPLDGVGVIQFGAAWDRKTKKQSGWAAKLAAKTGGAINVGNGKQKDVDLDLALVLYRDGEPKRVVAGWNMDPVGGSATHSGDNQTGEGDGDDETVIARLNEFPSWVTEWAVVVMAYKVGTNFDSAQNVSLNVYDTTNPAAPVKIDELMPTLGKNTTASIVATGKRNRDDTGEPINGWTVRVVDVSGRLQTQNDEDAILTFAKRNAGIVEQYAR